MIALTLVTLEEKTVHCVVLCTPVCLMQWALPYLYTPIVSFFGLTIIKFPRPRAHGIPVWSGTGVYILYMYNYYRQMDY